MKQTNFQNFLKYFLVFGICTLQILDSQAQTKNIKKADSLFSERKFNEAEVIYEDIKQKSNIVNPNIYLKLANISEIKEDFVKELFYLNLYFLKNPNEKVFEKMFEIANDNGYKGYEKNDLNYLFFYYRQFSNYIILAFLLLGVYIFGILFWKKIKKQFTPTRQKIIIFVYLLILISLINLPNQYNTAIIKHNQTYIRDFPSNAASILGNINVGNKINVINSDDIWLKILWNGQLCFVKESDVYLIK